MPVERQRALAAYRSADGLSEALLHGPAAASWLERELGVNDGEVLDAVAYHTVGKVGMGELAMVVWIADKIEPGRPSGISYHADSTGSIGLGALMRSVAERNAEYLLTHGWDLHPETERLLDFLRERYPS
jgi:nicotinate-nucleotide adenylyltransferase